MSAIWVVIGLCVVGAVGALAMSWLGGARPENLGTVSDHWISEHRIRSGEDFRR